jgi:hypothetical protein
VKVAIANFSPRVDAALDYEALWAEAELPAPRPRATLFEQELDWGFHVRALGVYLLDRGIADEVEFWNYDEPRSVSYGGTGILRVTTHNEADLEAYLERFGAPDLFVNYGRNGHGILAALEGRSFRVHVPCLRSGLDREENFGAECYLVDGPEYLDARSMLYVPVVNTQRLRSDGRPPVRDFVYLAAAYHGKRHDIAVAAARATRLTGHFHPVEPGQVDLAGAAITTSAWDEGDLVALLSGSRIAIYPGDDTSNPAGIWECIAAGLPIVVNSEIRGGKHAVVSGVTGELAAPEEFGAAMEHVLANRSAYRPREHLEEHWDTVRMLEEQLAFFDRMGFACS